MMKKLFLLFLLPAIILISISCGTEYEEPSQTKMENEDLPDQESWESTILITKDGKRVAEIWAGYIALFKQKNETVLRDSVHADFYDSQGRHNSVLTAGRGFINNTTNDLTAIGNVIVISDSGVVLETEELKWDNSLQKIVSEVPVKFTTLQDTLIGDSFISDPDLKNYEIRNARGFSRRAVPLEK